MDSFYIIFIYFFIYSICGWFLETIYCRLLDGKWTNRGFLFGPYCPIYGFGSLLIIYFLDNFKDNPIEVFFFGMIFTSVLEYITSFLLEKIFNAKWWDYTNYKFNINGRVCLVNSLEFAILGLVLTYIAHPFISNIVLQIPSAINQIVALLLFFIIGIDLCSTIASLLNLKEKLSMLEYYKEELKKKYPKKKFSDFEIYKELSNYRKRLVEKHNAQINRLLNAFPNFKDKTLEKQFEEFKLEIHSYRLERAALKKQKKEEKSIKRLDKSKESDNSNEKTSTL